MKAQWRRVLFGRGAAGLKFGGDYGLEGFGLKSLLTGNNNSRYYGTEEALGKPRENGFPTFPAPILDRRVVENRLVGIHQ